jgi:hypothetical protein
MAYIQWDAGSGSWGDAQDWNGGVPSAADTVVISPSNITVTIAAGTAAAAYTLSTAGSSTLDMTGGSLDTVDQASFSGAFVQTGGTYLASGLGAIFYGSINTAHGTAGGTITALAGATLTIVGGGILAGAITGTGSLDFAGGTTYINAGFTSSITNINVNALVGLDINFSTPSNLTVGGTGSLDLFGHTLTVSGDAIVDGTLGNGELKASGTLILGNPGGLAYLDNGLIVDLTGKLIQSGNASFGTSDAGAKVDIAKTGQYLLNGNVSILDFSSVGSLVNAGTFAKTAGGKVSQVNVSMANTGTINVETGTLLLNGLVNSLGGTMTGAGTLAVAGGETTFGTKAKLTVAGFTQESGILVLTRSLAYGGEWDMTGGVLNLDNRKTTLTLSHADFDGGTLTGYGGTVLLGGTTEMANMLIGGPNTLTVLANSTVDQTGNIVFGPSSNPTLNIDATGTWAIEGSSAISGPYGLIDNKGTFIDPNGSGTAVVNEEFESTGTVTVNNAALNFDGIATYLAGTVTGNGLLILAGATVLETGLGIGVTELAVSNHVVVAENLTYANNFSETYSGNVDLNGGSKLALTGTVSLDGGTLSDGGTMTVSGPLTLENYTILNSTLVLTGTSQSPGTVEQTGGVTLNGGDILIAANSTYTIDDNDSIVSVNGGSLTIAGDLIVDGYGQTSIDAIIDAAASLVVNGQTLTLNGVVNGTVDTGGTLGGAISGSGSLVLGAGTYAVAQGLSLTVAALAIDQSATVDLGANLSYAGIFADTGVIDITGAETLSLTGAASFSLGSTLTGLGTMVLSGGATLSGMTINAGATLELASATEQGPSNLSDLGTMAIAAGSTYTLDANQSILGTTGALDVTGTLVASGDGVSLLQVGIVDAGVIAANLGTLDVLSAVGGSGKFLVAAGATLEFANSSTITSTGTIQFQGTASAGATLVLQNELNFGAELAGFTTIGDAIELYDFVGSGTLTVQDSGHQALITDSNNDSITLSFTSTQTSLTLAIGMVNGHIAVIHT